MVFGLEFNDSFDLRAIGTGALALATFVSLFFARRALNKTQAQIELGQSQLKQTQKEIELSRKEVEQAHRPILIPTADTLQAKSGRSPKSGPDVPRANVLAVPVENIGSGPALQVQATIEPINPVGGHSWGGQHQARTVTGIGVSKFFLLEFQLTDISHASAFELTIAYKDVADTGWITSGRWSAQSGRYEDLTITAQGEDSLGLKQDAKLVKPVPPEG